jgi:hypothetical protein
MKSWQVLLDFANELLTQDTSVHQTVEFEQGAKENCGMDFLRFLVQTTAKPRHFALREQGVTCVGTALLE